MLMQQVKYVLRNSINPRKLCLVGFFTESISRENKKSSLKIFSQKIVLVKSNSLIVDNADLKIRT